MASLIKIIAIALLVAFAGLGISHLEQAQSKLELREIELKSTGIKLKELDHKYDLLNQQLDTSKKLNSQQIKELEQEKSKLEQEKKELEKQLQAKRKAKEQDKIAQASADLINKFTGTSTASAASGIDCKNQTTAKAFIYCHESGNVADIWNSSGCYGVGQDCNNVVYDMCGANYACQDGYFTDYMKRRYGTWEAAQAHWLARVPINGKDVGNWW